MPLNDFRNKPNSLSAAKLHEVRRAFAQSRYLLAGVALILITVNSAAGQTVNNGSDLNTDILNNELGTPTGATLTISGGTTVTTTANNEVTIAGTTSIEASSTYTAPFDGYISNNLTISGSAAGTSILDGGTTTTTVGATPLFIASPKNETATGGSTTPTPLHRHRLESHDH